MSKGTEYILTDSPEWKDEKLKALREIRDIVHADRHVLKSKLGLRLVLSQLKKNEGEDKRPYLFKESVRLRF